MWHNPPHFKRRRHSYVTPQQQLTALLTLAGSIYFKPNIELLLNTPVSLKPRASKTLNQRLATFIADGIVTVEQPHRSNRALLNISVVPGDVVWATSATVESSNEFYTVRLLLVGIIVIEAFLNGRRIIHRQNFVRVPLAATRGHCG